MNALPKYEPHPVVDLAVVKREYCAGGLGVICDVVNSDRFGVAATEFIRERAAGLLDEPTVPVDVFAFERGSPVAPYHTKFGGLPYRDPAIPWPQYRPTDEDAYFIGQICFVDSQDVFPVRELPGDVMLVYGVPYRDALKGFRFPSLGGHELHGTQVEWSSISDDLTMLVEAEKRSPAIERPTMLEYYGVRHRSCDFVDLGRAHAMVAKAWEREARYPELVDCAVRERKLKIGGFSCFSDPEHRSKRMGQHFAGFSGFFPSRLDIQWRREGRPMPNPFSQHNWDVFREGLGFYDSRRAEFFLDEKGTVRFVVGDPRERENVSRPPR